MSQSTARKTRQNGDGAAIDVLFLRAVFSLICACLQCVG